jgi:hypothetical protein
MIMPAAEGLAAYYTLLTTRNQLPRTRHQQVSDGSGFSVLGAWGALLRGHAIFLSTFALALIPQVLTYQTLYGQPRPSSTVAGKLEWSSPHFFQTLFDPQHGAFVWSPMLLLGLLGLGWMWRRDRLLAALLLLGFLAQTYINGAISTWHLSGSFGFRRLIDITPIFVLGLAALLAWLRARLGHWPLLLAALLLLGWNAGLIANWTVLHKEIRPGLIWPELWTWQIEAPGQALAKAGDLLFHRCGFVQNGRC